ncbi:DUF655 domain-containing protein [Pelomonas sp. SE-A7]|uniref:ComEA family DNA-binding protein n=1 Tax=Pelomonas sp. SE-A7 TaxID=3054953 RepID=UPI00259CFC8A|nr:DUF655 domain-containing protein [Pelomonas sp. SE-A7]MDM4765555.1 DUF655 domain-containing protein [Pelomonas sp. SE-A7]
MRRRLALLGLLAAVARAEPSLLEVNQASQAQLESLEGVGPALAERILRQRQRKAFESWADLRKRVGGLGEKQAARLSAQGLRVRGQAFQPN